MKRTTKLLACCLLAAGLFISTLTANAQAWRPQATLRWDASPTPGVTYVLTAYQLTAGGPVYVFTDCGTNLTADVLGLAGGLWQFTVQAKAGGLYSTPSNVLSLTLPAPSPNISLVITAPALGTVKRVPEPTK